MAGRRTGIGPLLLTGLLLAGCPRAEGPHATRFRLAVRYPPGAYVLTANLAATQDVTANGERRPRQELSQTAVFTVDVAAPDPSGLKRMVLGLRALRQDMALGHRRLLYDSAADAKGQDPALAAALAPLRDARLTVALDRDDRATDVAGLEGLWDRVPAGPPEAAEAVRAVRDRLSAEAVREMFTRARQMLPDRPVAVGEAWETRVEFAVPLLGRVPVRRQCRLQAVEESGGSRVAVIGLSSEAEPGGAGAAPAGADHIPLRMQVLSLEQSGELRLDADTGLPLGQTTVGRGRVALAATDAMRAAHEITVDFETRVRVTLSPAAPP